MKIKVFHKDEALFARSEKFASLVEQEINAWLDAHPRVKIIETRQAESRGRLQTWSIWVWIWYEESA